MQSHRMRLEKGSDQKAAAMCGLAGASWEWGCFQELLGLLACCTASAGEAGRAGWQKSTELQER